MTLLASLSKRFQKLTEREHKAAAAAKAVATPVGRDVAIDMSKLMDSKDKDAGAAAAAAGVGADTATFTEFIRLILEIISAALSPRLIANNVNLLYWYGGMHPNGSRLPLSLSHRMG
jgi:hypothetical protein